MTAFELRSAVANWLEFRLRHDPVMREGFHGSGDYAGLDPAKLEPVVRQIIADIHHSSLLLRMLDGKRPLPEAEYKALRDVV